MALLGIDFNDAALTGVIDGELCFTEPGYALAPDGELLFGQAARALARRYPRRLQNRFWEELTETPLAETMASAGSAADLAHAQLKALWDTHGQSCDAVVFAVPPTWSGEQLGLLLGIAEEEGMPVRGFVDSAVAATRREYPGADLIAVEARLHNMDVRLMQQQGLAAAGEYHNVPGLGVERLENIAVDYCAGRFVAEARFDPLHDATSEQALYDQLDSWLPALIRDSQVQAELHIGGEHCAVTLEQAGLAGRITDACQPLLQRLRSLLPAGRPVAIQLGARLGAFPGVVEALQALPDTALFVLDAGAAARGAARVLNQPAGGALRLVTRLGWDQPPAPVLAPAAGETRAVPTHLLAGSQAYRLEARPLFIGTAADEGDYCCLLDGSPAGVSRRHCSVQLDGGRVILSDHSRYGTQLNGHPIDGSAVLQAGDTIGVGNPPREFHVVIEVAADGA